MAAFPLMNLLSACTETVYSFNECPAELLCSIKNSGYLLQQLSTYMKIQYSNTYLREIVMLSHMFEKPFIKTELLCSKFLHQIFLYCAILKGIQVAA